MVYVSTADDMTTHRAIAADLRTRQAELTRTLILQALADRLAEDDPLEFSVQEVADRAGVSHRTVYRHFATREALLDALANWLEERLMDRAHRVEHVDDVPASVRHNFRSIEEFSPAVDVLIRLGVTGDTHSRHTRRRTQALLDAVAEVTGHLRPDVAEAMQWTIRHLASHQTWVRLRRDGGIEGARSGEAVAWAVETLIDALRKGGGPTPSPQEAEAPGRSSDGHEHDAPSGRPPRRGGRR